MSSEWKTRLLQVAAGAVPFLVLGAFLLFGFGPRGRAFALRSIIALIPVFLFFILYFRHFVFSRDVLWQTKAFFFGLISSVVAFGIQYFLLKRSDSPVIEAFVHASLVEETVRFAFIYMRIRRSSETFTVMEGVFDGILIGLGFSFAENLLFSLRNESFVILLRCISSVPMHVFVSGIMAYFLSYRFHCRYDPDRRSRFNRFRMRRAVLLISAMMIPWVFHGFFDLVLFVGGDWNYLLPVFLILGYMNLEYLMARSRLVISRNVLDMLGIDADDMEIIQRQKEYEKWMADRQTSDEPPPAFFLNQWSMLPTAGGAILVVFAVTMGMLYIFNPRILFFDHRITKQILLSLLVWMPLSIGSILLLAEKINFLFIRENMLRLPRVSIASIRRGDLEWDTIILDILPQGVFLTGVQELKAGETVELGFTEEIRRPIWFHATVRWVNTAETNLPVGALVRYLSGGAGFRFYWLRYSTSKFFRRLRHGFVSVRGE